MNEIKTGPARHSFWCNILTAENPAAKSAQARTVRGPYTAFNLANSQRDRTGNPIGEGQVDGESQEKN
jgi:hypothetical protein